MKKNVFKLGTRGSPLALWQAERVKSLLSQRCPEAEIEIVTIQTTGDRILDKPLVQLGGKGVFTKEIENALLDERIDFAVHSFKDLPTVLPQGLEIVSIPERDSPFDAIFSRSASCLKDLPPDPMIATGSLRRRAQVLAARPDATVIDIRGNVNTRLKKFRESDWDALIMAEAGARRMGWRDQIAGVLSVEEMLPAPAQGAIAIEARIDDEAVRDLLLTIHDKTTAAIVLAERAFLATLEGGCQVPIAAYAMVDGENLNLEGLIASLDGSPIVRESKTGSASCPDELGRNLAQAILDHGGREIIDLLSSLNG